MIRISTPAEPSMATDRLASKAGVGQLCRAAAVLLALMLPHAGLQASPGTEQGSAASEISTPEAPAQPNLATVRMMVLGDSLSSAYGMKEEAGWVSRLERRLKKFSTDVDVFNAAIAGETSGGGLYRLPGLLSKHNPNLVVVELGANDGLRGLSLKKLAENLDEIVRLSLDNQATVILVGVPVTANYGSYVSEKMHSIYQDVSSQHAIAMVDFFDSQFYKDPKYFQEDGLHPTADTQKLIADKIWQEVEPAALKLHSATGK